jgi:ABC-type nitrate/sulfonate/bicarbonate transport system permease component
MKSSITQSALKVLYIVVALVFVLGIWVGSIKLFNVPGYVIPSPGATWTALRGNWPELRPLMARTLYETAVGFGIGVAVGVVAAIVMAHVRVLGRIFYPILIATQAVPTVAMAAPLVIIMGFGMGPKLVIVALIVFFPVVVNVLDGLAQIDKDTLALARSMGAGNARVFLLIRLPAILTPLFSALKMTATFAVTGAVIGEWTASAVPGLGNDILLRNSKLDAAGVWADVLLLTVIGLGGFALMLALERLATPWRQRSTARRWFRRPDPVVVIKEPQPAKPAARKSPQNTGTDTDTDTPLLDPLGGGPYITEKDHR